MSTWSPSNVLTGPYNLTATCQIVGNAWSPSLYGSQFSDGEFPDVSVSVAGPPIPAGQIRSVIVWWIVDDPGSGLVSAGFSTHYFLDDVSYPHTVLASLSSAEDGNTFDHIEVSYSGSSDRLYWYPVGHPLWTPSTGWTGTFNPTTGQVTIHGPGGTVTRTDPVHGAVPIPGVDNGDGTYTDPWPPLNDQVEYEVDDGTGPTTLLVDTTVPGPEDGGDGGMPRLSVISQPALILPPVTLIDYTGAYPARNTVHDILDRVDPVVVQREPGLRRGELTFVFDDHGAAMGIADAYRTGRKISLRQATHDRLDVVHIATGDVQITPEHGGLAWRLRVAYTEVAP